MPCIRGLAVIVGIALMLAGCGELAFRAHAICRDRAAPAPRPSRTQTRPVRRLHWNGTVTAHMPTGPFRVSSPGPCGGGGGLVGAERRAGPGCAVRAGRGPRGQHGGPRPPFYYAFYSTTRLRFRPVHLFDVSPGDRVGDAAATRRAVAVVSTTGPSAAGGGCRWPRAPAALQRGAVGQEDVTDAAPTGRFRIRVSPRCASPGSRPTGWHRGARLTSSWLTEADGYFAPAPFHTAVHARTP